MKAKTFLLSICSAIGLSAMAQPPVLVKDIFPGSNGSNIGEIVKTTNYTFFTADDDDADTDKGLFRTDGTTEGTIKLNLVYPGYISTKADFLTPLGNKVVFAGDNNLGYYEMWSSDGTQEGTILLEQYYNNSNFSMRSWSIAAMDGSVYYSIVTNDLHFQLHRTDGTREGTSMIKDFGIYNDQTPATIIAVTLFKVVNNIMYFDVYAGDGTDNIWKTDGTAEGTQLVKVIPLNTGISSFFMPAGNNFYFFVINNGQTELWKSDGTTTGTLPIKTISTFYSNNSYPSYVAVGNVLYFVNNTSANGKELWKTDGTDAGTVLTADIYGGPAGSDPSELTTLNGKLYFFATSPAYGRELWRYDGANASLVNDIYPGATGSNPSSLAVSNNVLFFSANDGIRGNELWASDDILDLTIPILPEINPGIASSFPALLTPGNPIYFSADEGVHGKELFKYANPLGCASLQTFYHDADGDGYGNAADSKQDCTAPAGYVAIGGDCNDNNPSIHPNAPEICGNGIDDNCDGQIDEGCPSKISINNISVLESEGQAVLTVSLSQPSVQDVKINYATVDGTAVSKGKKSLIDYGSQKGSVTIAAGSTATISIPIMNDGIAEGAEQFTVVLSIHNNTSATIESGVGTVTINDGLPVTTAVTKSKMLLLPQANEQFFITVFPNPAIHFFHIVIHSSGNEKTMIRVMDMLGRVIETIKGVPGDSTIKIGQNLRPGTYFIEAIQGNEHVTQAVIKQ